MLVLSFWNIYHLYYFCLSTISHQENVTDAVNLRLRNPSRQKETSHFVRKAFAGIFFQLFHERQNDAMGDLPHGLTWQEYQAWHTKATQARDAYVAGKLSTEETIKIINDTDIN